MKHLTAGCGLSATLLLLTACGEGLTDEGGPQRHLGASESQPFITTDQDSYEAEHGEMVVAGDTVWYLEFTIETTYTNGSDEPVLVLTCGGPYHPRLERLVDGQWETAYAPPQTLCGGPYLRVEPGETLDYEFRIQGHDPDSSVRPAWNPDDVEETYRVHFWSTFYTGPDGVSSDEIAYGDLIPVPLDERISNTFEVTGSLP